MLLTKDELRSLVGLTLPVAAHGVEVVKSNKTNLVDTALFEVQDIKQ